MILTQDQYKLWTGQTIQFDNSDWAQIVAVSAARLASFLCLPNGLPIDPDSKDGSVPADLQELLSNFIAGVFATQGSTSEITSKHVRNFTINFRTTASDVFAMIAEKYGDIIEFYSNCGLTFKVEGDAKYNCDGGCGCDE